METTLSTIVLSDYNRKRSAMGLSQKTFCEGCNRLIEVHAATMGLCPTCYAEAEPELESLYRNNFEDFIAACEAADNYDMRQEGGAR